MNARERRLAGRIYGCLNTMTSLRSPNPADVLAVSHNLKISVKTASALRAALEHLMHEEYEMAGEYIDDAETALREPAPAARFRYSSPAPPPQT